MTHLKFAVFVDGENIQHQQYSRILKEVESQGSIAIKWVYGDWTSPHLKNWQTPLHQTASRPKQQFHYGKDAADHALIMDAIELFSRDSRVNALCIVSSDGGFYSLAQRIREYGHFVMAIGSKRTPERFRKACHNFVYFDNLSEKIEEAEYDELETLLIEAYTRCATQNEPVYMGDMGSKLKEIDSAFDSRTYGHSNLKKLIKAKSDLFELVGERDDRCFIQIK